MEALKRATKDLIESQPYPAIFDFNANTGENIVRLGRVPEPPSEISAMVGDVLFNLRCALDHIVWALSKPPLTCKPNQIKFPVFEHPGQWTASDGGAAKHIGDIPPAAQAVIECLQPYKSGKPKLDPLYLLNKLNNLDKHRALHVVQSFPHRADILSSSPDVLKVTTAPPPAGGFVEGAEIGRVMFTGGRSITEMDVKFLLSRDILFGPGPARKASMHWLLRRMRDAVAVALGRLETFL